MNEPRRHLHIPSQIKGLLKRHGQPQAMWYVGTLHAENGRDVRTKSTGSMPKEFGRPLDVRRPGGDPEKSLRSTSIHQPGSPPSDGSASANG